MTTTHTTRYVTLLSVVLALVLTAALAACGSEEPSGVTGPDRTASTPGSGDAPTATDAPATPAASGSAETDRKPWLPSTTQRTVRTGLKAPTG